MYSGSAEKRSKTAFAHIKDSHGLVCTSGGCVQSKSSGWWENVSYLYSTDRRRYSTPVGTVSKAGVCVCVCVCVCFDVSRYFFFIFFLLLEWIMTQRVFESLFAETWRGFSAHSLGWVLYFCSVDVSLYNYALPFCFPHAHFQSSIPLQTTIGTCILNFCPSTDHEESHGSFKCQAFLAVGYSTTARVNDLKKQFLTRILKFQRTL